MILIVLSGTLALITSAVWCVAAFFIERLKNLRQRLRTRIDRMRKELLLCEAEGMQLRDKATHFVTSLNSETVRALYELNRLLGQVSDDLRRAENIYQAKRYGEFPTALAHLSAIEEHAVPGSIYGWREQANNLLGVIRHGVNRSDALVKSLRRANAVRKLKTPSW